MQLLHGVAAWMSMLLEYTEWQISTGRRKYCSATNSVLTHRIGHRPPLRVFFARTGNARAYTESSPVTTDDETVAELLSNINKRKATGCDGISARALKLAGTTLAPSLCGLFNQSIQDLKTLKM